MKRSCIFMCFVCVIVLTSCSRAPELIFFNNSGYSVKICVESFLMVSDDYKVRFYGPIEHGNTVEFSYTFDQQISIQTETTNWVYQSTEYLPREYFGLSSSAEIRFQLESTGEIYVLLPTEEFPLTDFTNQPPGFPLKPILQPLSDEGYTIIQEAP